MNAYQHLKEVSRQLSSEQQSSPHLPMVKKTSRKVREALTTKEKDLSAELIVLGKELNVDVQHLQDRQKQAVKMMIKLNVIPMFQTFYDNTVRVFKRKYQKNKKIALSYDLSEYLLIAEGSGIDRFFGDMEALGQLTGAIYRLPETFDTGMSDDIFGELIKDFGAALRAFVYEDNQPPSLEGAGTDDSTLLDQVLLRQQKATFLMFSDQMSMSKGRRIFFETEEELKSYVAEMTDYNLMFFLMLCREEHQDFPFLRKKIISAVSEMFMMLFLGSAFDFHFLLKESYAQNILRIWVEAHKTILADNNSILRQAFIALWGGEEQIPTQLATIIESGRPFPQPKIVCVKPPFRFQVANLDEIKEAMTRKNIQQLRMGVLIDSANGMTNPADANGFFTINSERLLPGTVHNFTFYCLTGDENELIPVSESEPIEIKIPFPTPRIEMSGGSPFSGRITNWQDIQQSAERRGLEIKTTKGYPVSINQDGSFDFRAEDFTPGRRHSVGFRVCLQGQLSPLDLFPEVRLPEVLIPFPLVDVVQSGTSGKFLIQNIAEFQPFLKEGDYAFWFRKKGQARQSLAVQDGTFDLEGLPVEDVELFFRLAPSATSSMDLFPEQKINITIEYPLPVPAVTQQENTSHFLVRNMDQAQNTSRKKMDLYAQINGLETRVLLSRNGSCSLGLSAGEHEIVFYFKRNGEASSFSEVFKVSISKNPVEPLQEDPEVPPEVFAEKTTEVLPISLEEILETVLSGIDAQSAMISYQIDPDGNIFLTFHDDFWAEVQGFWEADHKVSLEVPSELRSGIMLIKSFIDQFSHEGCRKEFQRIAELIQQDVASQKKEIEKSGQGEEIAEWKAEHSTAFNLFKKAERVFQALSGQWETSRGGRTDMHWKHICRTQETNTDFTGELSHLHRTCKEAGILFTSPALGRGSNFSGIELFRVQSPLGEIEGCVRAEGESIHVIFSKTPEPFPVLWQKEMESVARGIFLSIVEITSRYGNFKPRSEYEKRRKAEGQIDTNPPTQKELRGTLKRIFEGRCRFPIFSGEGEERVLVDEEEISLEAFLGLPDDAEILTRGNHIIITERKESETKEVDGHASVTGDRIEDLQESLLERYENLLIAIKDNPYLKKYVLERLVSASATARKLSPPNTRAPLPEIARKRSEDVLKALGIDPVALTHKQIKVEDLLQNNSMECLVEKMILSWREKCTVTKDGNKTVEQVSVSHSKPKLLPVSVLKEFVLQVRETVESTHGGFYFSKLDVSALSKSIKASRAAC